MVTRPDNEDRRKAIGEQWWPGIVFWVAIVLIFWGISTCGGRAAELPPPVATIRVSWTQPPPAFLGAEVNQWKIYRTHPLPRVQIAVTEVPHAYITVAEGEKIVVVSCTSTEESKDSTEWTVRLPYPDPIVRVTVQTSTDNKTFTDHQAFEFRKSQAEFYRFKIEPAIMP